MHISAGTQPLRAPTPQSRDTQTYMNKAMLHMPLPDTVFFYNSGDYSMCGDPELCPVPMLTHIKIWAKEHKQSDILVPQLRYMPNELYHWPWEQKAPVGGWHQAGCCGSPRAQSCCMCCCTEVGTVLGGGG